MGIVTIFDFLSHPTMHLPFNEGYLKVLRHVFPDDEIIFAAQQGHIDNLKGRFSSGEDIKFLPIKPFSISGNYSRHNPFFGRKAAGKCWQEVEKVVGNNTPVFAALMGMEANLLAVFPQQWQKEYPNTTFHYILHNHLSAAMAWRSRNPFYRWFDFLSVFKRGLPEKQKILALELGMTSVLEQIAPQLKGSILTLEHPVLESEWLEEIPVSIDRPLRIGFVGHCGTGKGFDFFVQLANEYSGNKFEFFAIGRKNPNIGDLDLSSLTLEPSSTSVPREIFVNNLNRMDMICLPIPKNTAYVTSGSLIDGFTALKPLILTENSSNKAIEKKYGEYGKIYSRQSEMKEFFSSYSVADFQKDQPKWIENMKKIRAGRTAKALARDYRELIFE